MDRGFVYPSGPVLRSTVARSSAGRSTMRSNFVLPALLFVIALPFQSCVKDTAEIAQEVGLLPAGCGSDGARLQATVGGSSYCATAQLLAVGGEGSVMLTGVDLSGNTLILQLDTLGVGTHAITEASNSMLYMQTGSSFVSGPDSEGTLIDRTAQRVHPTLERHLRRTGLQRAERRDPPGGRAVRCDVHHRRLIRLRTGSGIGTPLGWCRCKRFP